MEDNKNEKNLENQEETNTNTEETQNTKIEDNLGEADNDFLKDEIIKALEKNNIKLKERNEKVEKDINEIKNRYVRTLADIENLRKRTKKEVEDMKKYAVTSLLKDFLPVGDNLKRALEHTSEEERKENPLAEGVTLVYKQFLDALEKNSVKSFDSLNEIFDPTKHEALQMVDNDELPHNTVITEYEKGYLIGDRLLRAAKVIVTKNNK